MRYVSNLAAPDLRPFFKLANPMLQKMGHDVPSDPDFDPNCGFLSDDEAAILYAIARAWPKRWVDIGARFGWSTAHISEGACQPVDAVDPEYAVLERYERAVGNVSEFVHLITQFPWISELYFATHRKIDAAMIDGNHDAPEPTNDALRAIDAGAQVLVFHDFAGKPIRDAVNILIAHGIFNARVYWTPNLMAVAWRDGCGFTPPDHVRDPRADWSGMERIVAEDFDVRRCV